MRRIISMDTKYRMRELVKGDLSKYEAAKVMNISYQTVLKFTQDLPSKRGGNRNLSEKSVEVLQAILKDGYFMPPKGFQMRASYLTLNQRFPIKRLFFKGETMLYFEDRKEEAFRAFVKVFGSKVVTYNKLKELSGLFGIELDKKIREEIVGKDPENPLQTFHISREAKLAQRRLKAQNNGFIGSFLLSELLSLHS